VVAVASLDSLWRVPPRRAARALLQRFGVEAIEHIHVEGFAARLDVRISLAPLGGAAAQLIAPGDGPAEILLSDRVRDLGARRFNIAHELGHYVLRHPSPSFAEMCTPLADGQGLSRIRGNEVDANVFASELLMPEPLVRSACDVRWASLEPGLQISAAFRVPARAGVVRFIELTTLPCAVVLSKRGAVRWTAPSAAFPWAIAHGRPLDRRSIAWSCFDHGGLRAGAQLVPGAAWLDGSVDMPLMEHSVSPDNRDTVLTMLAVPDEASWRAVSGSGSRILKAVETRGRPG
jgi:hypothetical protein